MTPSFGFGPFHPRPVVPPDAATRDVDGPAAPRLAVGLTGLPVIVLFLVIALRLSDPIVSGT